MDVHDTDLESYQPKSIQEHQPITPMSSAIHLFKLARFNSEIKCVLYCVDRLYPPYTAPAITDVVSWREDMLNRLRLWKEDIPRQSEGYQPSCTNLLCEIKYHELVMLVLRPSPLFQNPSKAALRECFSSAMKCSMLYHKLYTSNKIQYSWISVHSLFLCVITMFYCVWTPGGVADEVNFDTLVRALRFTSDILSATGEYWPEAKRSRDVLDRISTATMQRFTRKVNSGTQRHNELPGSQNSLDLSPMPDMGRLIDIDSLDSLSQGFSAHQFDDGSVSVSTGEFPPFYAEQSDAFTNTDMLSYFMGAGGNVTMPNGEMFGDGYPSMDEVMKTFFEEGLRDSHHSV
jgi:hypothetical protein